MLSRRSVYYPQCFEYRRVLWVGFLRRFCRFRDSRRFRERRPACKPYPKNLLRLFCRNNLTRLACRQTLLVAIGMPLENRLAIFRAALDGTGLFCSFLSVTKTPKYLLRLFWRNNWTRLQITSVTPDPTFESFLSHFSVLAVTLGWDPSSHFLNHL